MEELLKAVKKGDDRVMARLLDAEPALLETTDKKGDPPLLVAAQFGRLKTVMLLIQRGADVNAKGASGMTPLYLAALKGHEDVVGFLLSQGAQIDTKDTADRTPLMMASMLGHVGVMRMLVEQMAPGEHNRAQELEERDDKGGTALYWAAVGGQEGAAGFLLSIGAHVGTKDNGDTTPLMVASGQGHVGVVRVLAQHLGAQGLEERDKEGKTALHWAAHEEVAAFLLEQGAQATAKDKTDRTPLILRSMLGHLGAVRVLAQHMGSQGLEERDVEGKTALHWAALANRKDVAVVLMEQGAQATSKDADGMTALMDACSAGHLGVVQVLVQQMGVQGLEERDDKGRTAFYCALIAGEEEIMAFLLEQGAQTNIRDQDDTTPLSFACVTGLMGGLRVLAHHLGVQGLDERDEKGWTVLHVAAVTGREEVVAFLLKQGVQANGRDNNGVTPLMLASYEGRVGVARVLLRYVGVQGLNGRDERGETALNHAACEGHEEVMRLLLLSGADPHSTDNEGSTPRTLAEDKGHADCVAVLEVSPRTCLAQRATGLLL
jgi:ankyrin repeat protein